MALAGVELEMLVFELDALITLPPPCATFFFVSWKYMKQKRWRQTGVELPIQVCEANALTF